MNPICSRNKPGPSLLLTREKHWRSQALETKLNPELPRGINQKSQKFMNNMNESMAPGLWGAPRGTQDFQGRWMCLLIQVWNWPFPGWLPNLLFISAFSTLSYCSFLIPWLLDPNVLIDLFASYHKLYFSCPEGHTCQCYLHRIPPWGNNESTDLLPLFPVMPGKN